MYSGTSACRGRSALETSTRDALRLTPEGRRLDSTGSFSARRPYGEYAKENGEEKEKGSEPHRFSPVANPLFSSRAAKACLMAWRTQPALLLSSAFAMASSISLSSLVISNANCF